MQGGWAAELADVRHRLDSLVEARMWGWTSAEAEEFDRLSERELALLRSDGTEPPG